MNKTTKKQVNRLHFDTSSANINCFIKGKTYSNSSQSYPVTQSHRNKRKNRKNAEKHIEYQDKAFLESVVCKILNDNDCQGITKLIQDMVFPQSEENQHSNNKDITNDEIQHLQISEIFSSSNFLSKNSTQKNNNISFVNKEIYPNYYTSYSGQYNNEDKNDLGTTIHSYNSMSPREMYQSNNANMLNQTNSLPFNYGYQYYPQQDCFRQQYGQRKKRSGQDSNQYKINLQQIQIDGRTTLMIRHIPNKYTEEMLYQEIGRNNKMKVNFLYLPMDHHNACNVGYAFVNFIHTKFILDFYQEFNGRRWDKFNSEKRCQLAYARIQGASSLMDHFQNSQLKGRIKLQEKKTRVNFDQCAYEDITRIINTQQQQEF